MYRSTPISSVLNLIVLSIPPELFMHIASFIPLRSAPKTLLSLALGNHRFHQIFRPILYSRLILRNEDDATKAIQRILGEHALGLSITQIHLMSELSNETGDGEAPHDVLVGLQMLVRKHLLPRLSSLSICLLKGWYFSKNRKLVTRHGRLLVNFWTDLRIECPRLRSLMLRNVGHDPNDRWLSDAVIDEINSLIELSSLCLEFSGDSTGPPKKEINQILNNLPRLASLHTLSIGGELTNGEHLFSLSLPNLRWLCLNNFVAAHDTRNAMDFFNRHPQLESLSLLRCMGTWFSTDIAVGFLPNLKHLKARFEDILRLVPILAQLVSLAIVKSYNAQVPYLLRAILPSGLPDLKSLEIRQSTAGWDSRKLEGVLWYETLDGQFRLQNTKKRIPRDFMNGYMHSIVRGAPNLEELGLEGMWFTSEHLQTLAPTLSGFLKLERFYYYGFSPHPRLSSPIPEEEHPGFISDFLSSAAALARVCKRLDSVTSNSGSHLPYLSGIIERSSAGEVIGIRRSEGCGMLISAHEDDPFPRHV